MLYNILLAQTNYYVYIYGMKIHTNMMPLQKIGGEYYPKLETRDQYNLRIRSEIIGILEKYSMFLEENGYMDIDWRTEEPFAIDEFLKE